MGYPEQFVTTLRVCFVNLRIYCFKRATEIVIIHTSFNSHRESELTRDFHFLW